jgi:hypothetical protein
MLKGASIASAGALGLVLLAGPLAAQNYDSIKLEVPVKLKNMHPDAKFAAINCEIWGSEIILGQYGSVLTVNGGHVDKVVSVSIRPTGGGTFVGAKAAVCSLLLTNKNDPSLGYQKAVKGSPPSADIWRLGKPDEYFMQTFRYPLDGAKFVPGIAGPKDDLTAQPKQKE